MKFFTHIAVFALLLVTVPVHSTTYYWVRATGGNWTSASSWSLTSGGVPLAATFPGALDVAVFDNGGSGTCTIAANATVLTCSLAATYTGIVQMNAAITLTLSTSFIVNAGTFTQAAGIIADNGTFNMGGGTYNGGSGYFTCVGSWNKTAGTMTAPVTMDLGGNFSQNALSGTFNHNNGTVIMRGATPWFWVGVFLYNLVLQPTTTMTMTAQANADIMNSITFNGTGAIRINTGNLNFWGSTINLNNTSTAGGGTGSITLIGGMNQTLTSTVPAGQSKLPNLIFQKTGGGFAVANAVSVEGNLTNVSSGCMTVYSPASVIAMCGTIQTINLYGNPSNPDIHLPDLTIMNGSTVTLGQRLYLRSLRIEAGGSLDVSAGNYLLDMTGNWNNLNSTAASFNERQGTVRMYSGTIYAAIAGGESFYDLLLDDPVNGQSVITLNSRITIIHSMSSTMYSTYNVVYGSSSNFVLFLDNATAGPPNWPFQTFAITGPVIKLGDDAFSFPCGDVVAGQVYPRPICMSAPAATNESFVAQYYHANSDPTYPHASRDPALITLSDCEYWVLGRLAGTSSVYVSLTWYSPLMGPCQVVTPSDLRVARWNGSMWVNEGQSATSGNATMGTVTSLLPFAPFSQFTLGSVTTANPLPIELVDFNAAVNEHSVDLNWETATETNNDFFTIERSRDGTIIESIDTIDGAGNSSDERNYMTVDNHPYDGVSYYRLKQVDYNGHFTYSPWKEVEVSPSETMQVWPNPSQGSFNIDLPGDPDAQWEMTVISVTGQTLIERSGQVPDMQAVNLDLPAGSYVLTMRSGESAFCEKIIVTE